MASGMSESTRQRVDDILTASKMELELEAEAELNARLKEMEKRAEGIAGVIERAADRDRMGRQLSDDEGGYVDASAPAVREDILEARRVAGRLKEELYFCQGDHLDMADAKVKQRPVLEKDIDEREREFRAVKENQGLAEVHDLAEMASESISDIKSIGQEYSASVVHATTIIGLIGDAFRAFCQSLQVDTRIRQEATEAIQQFKEYSKKRLEKLKDVDMSAAEQLLEQAFEQLSISQDRAASELSASDDQGKQVKESNRLKLFDNLFRDVTGSIEEELRDLKSMQEHCADDITKAEQQRKEMLLKHGECDETYQGTIAKYETQLEENEKQQQKLLLQLEKLREKAVVLSTAKEEEDRMQQTALSAISDAAQEIDQEIGKVKDLEQRSRAAIEIMKTTKGLSELIFDSAVQKERLIQQTLKERQLEAFHVYRQTLLESAVAHKIEANDHNVNVQHLKNQIQQLTTARLQKAKTGLKAMVDKIQTQIEELETELQIERSKRTQNTEELASLEKQIEEVDKQYTDEDQLETIEMLYEKRLDEIQHFWNTAEDNLPYDSVRQDEKS